MSAKVYDVAVIGSGLMGAAAARHVQCEVSDVVLIGQPEPADRRSHRGVFASHYDSGRIVRSLDRDPLWATLARRAVAGFAALEARSGVRFFHPVGALKIGPADPSRSDYVATLVAEARRSAVPFDLLDARSINDMLFPARVADDMAGVLTRDQSGYLDPRAHIRAQQGVFLEEGGTILDGIVRRIDFDGANVRIVHEGGEAVARRVIVATGTFTNQIEYPGRRLQLSGEKWSVLLARVSGRQLEALARLPCTLYKPVPERAHLYLLPPIRYPDGQWYLKIGSPFKDGVDPDLGAMADWFRKPVPIERQAHMRELLDSILGSVAFDDIHFDTCCGTQTPTAYPYIDVADDPRIVWLVGCNTYAAKSADELGRLAARLLLDGEWRDPIDRQRFRACYETA
jgi:sarcosine oxidase